jgi:uncharacterized membrane protein YdjX (TVP38/TMEM64 family)
MPGGGDRFVRQYRKRIGFLLVMVLALTAVAATEPLHRAIRSAIDFVAPFIERHPIGGAIVFILLSALSAMVVFFSTAAITPIAVDAFGPVVALLLLWSGWILGGVTAYAIGRFMGRRVASWLIEPRRLIEYTRRAKRISTFSHVLLFQVAIPSEIPGYVLGLSGCRFRTYLAAIAIGELPYAIGAIFLGDSFLDRNYIVLLAVGLSGVALSWIVFSRAAAQWASDGEPVSNRPVGLAVDDHDRPDGRDEQSEVLTHTEAERGV